MVVRVRASLISARLAQHHHAKLGRKCADANVVLFQTPMASAQLEILHAATSRAFAGKSGYVAHAACTSGQTLDIEPTHSRRT
jgi:hypothetical protein